MLPIYEFAGEAPLASATRHSKQLKHGRRRAVGNMGGRRRAFSSVPLAIAILFAMATSLCSPGFAQSGPTQTIIATSVTGPIAVDSNGNLYANGQSSMVELTPSGGGYAETTLPLPASPGIAVDGSGNLYIAPSPILGSSPLVVYKETPSAGSYTQSTLVPSTTLLTRGGGEIGVDRAGDLYYAGYYVFTEPPPTQWTDQLALLLAPPNSGGGVVSTPYPNSWDVPQEYFAGALAVDAVGDVFFWDGAELLEAPMTISGGLPSFGALITVYSGSSGFTPNAGPAVNSAGNIYIFGSDASGNSEILEESKSQGLYTAATIPVSGVSHSAGIAADSMGNIYISDADNSDIVKLTPPPPEYGEEVVGANFPCVQSDGGMEPADIEAQQNGAASLSWTVTGLNGPHGVTVSWTISDADGTLASGYMSGVHPSSTVTAGRTPVGVPVISGWANATAATGACIGDAQFSAAMQRQN